MMKYNRGIGGYSSKPEEVILKRCLYVNLPWSLKIEVLVPSIKVTFTKLSCQ